MTREFVDIINILATNPLEYLSKLLSTIHIQSLLIDKNLSHFLSYITGKVNSYVYANKNIGNYTMQM